VYVCSKLSSPQFGAVLIQSERIEIWVKEELASAGRIAGAQDMTFDTFSLILTKSTKDQHPHLDLGKPLVQYSMILSDDVTSTVCYDVKNPFNTDTISDLPKLFFKIFQLSKIWRNNGKAIDAFNNKLMIR